jgi:hypothetical protein
VADRLAHPQAGRAVLVPGEGHGDVGGCHPCNGTWTFSSPRDGGWAGDLPRNGGAGAVASRY